MTYWENRAVEATGRMESTVNGSVPELVQSFEAARRDLNTQIERFFTRYADNNQISLAEAQKQLSLSELKDFKGEVEDYIRLAKDSIGTFNLEVDNLSVKARITRLEALQMQCDAILQRLYQEQRKQIEGVATGIYTSEYYHRLFDIEKYIGFQFEFSEPATSLIQKVIQQPIYGMDISEHLWRQDIDTGFRIRKALNNMFITGKPPQYFAEELGKAIGAVQVDKSGRITGKGKKYEAYRLLYNESAHCVNQAQMQAYKDDGIDKYENIATLDKSTCETCGSMDGTHFPVSKAVEGENQPSFHVNCRCTTAPYITDINDLGDSRIARDPITGENEVTTAKNYTEWRKQLDEKYGKKKIDLIQKMAQNESTDFVQYKKYKSILKSNELQSFANFQDLKYNNPKEWKLLNDQYRTTSHLQKQLSYVYKGEKQFIPENAIIKKVRIIAGKSSQTPIRCEKSLIAKYRGLSGEWTKKVGKIESSKYMFDVHWYEYNGKQYEAKMKYRKEIK